MTTIAVASAIPPGLQQLEESLIRARDMPANSADPLGEDPRRPDAARERALTFFSG